MTKLKRKWVLIGVVIGVATVISIVLLGFLIYLTTFHADWGRVYNNYVKMDGDYFRMDVTVREFRYFEQYDECYLYVSEPCEDQFVICAKTCKMLADSDFFDVVEEGTVITIYTHPYVAWDGWDMPVVGVEIGDKIYVDFATGKQNWLDTLAQRREESGFLQTPIK